MFNIRSYIIPKIILVEVAHHRAIKPLCVLAHVFPVTRKSVEKTESTRNQSKNWDIGWPLLRGPDMFNWNHPCPRLRADKIIAILNSAFLFSQVYRAIQKLHREINISAF